MLVGMPFLDNRNFGVFMMVFDFVGTPCMATKSKQFHRPKRCKYLVWQERHAWRAYQTKSIRQTPNNANS